MSTQVTTTDTYTVALDGEVDDAAWDAFLQGVPGGHYTQSSAWGRYKATSDWRAARAVVLERGEVVAGTQLLVRPLPVLGAVGLVHHGPVVAPGAEAAAPLALTALQRLCRRERVRYVELQASEGAAVPEALLHAQGFRTNDRAGSPGATARVDLRPQPEEILARMRRSTRANVRRGLARGLTARLGGDGDLAAVLELYAQAARRKDFVTMARSRYEALWDALGRRAGLAQLFLVETEGELVSAQLGVRFGEGFYSHLMAWSGRHAERKPNELLDWTAMTWARANGCRFYDFEGITATEPGPLEPEAVHADCYVSDYKLGYGAVVVPLPGHYEQAPNPLLRWGLQTALPKVQGRPAVQRLERYVASTVSGRRRDGNLLRDEGPDAAPA